MLLIVVVIVASGAAAGIGRGRKGHGEVVETEEERCCSRSRCPIRCCRNRHDVRQNTKQAKKGKG